MELEAGEQVWGNVPVWTKFETDLPFTALLEGPRGVGKFMGSGLIAKKVFGATNVLAVQNLRSEDMVEVNLWTHHHTPEDRVCVIDLGGCSTSALLQLKAVLKSPHRKSRVWVTLGAGQGLRETLASTAYVYQFSALTPEELRNALGPLTSVNLADKMISESGSVDRALELSLSSAVQNAISSWIEAVEYRQVAPLFHITDNWEKRHTEMLVMEIEAQVRGETLVGGSRLTPKNRKSAMNMIPYLQSFPDSALAAEVVALTLMRSRA